MLLKIENFQQFVPYGAQYVNILSEQNGVYSVEYYIDSEKRNPAYHQGYDGLVLEKHRLLSLINEKEFIDKLAGNIEKNADALMRKISYGIGGVVGWVLDKCDVVKKCDTYYAVVVDASMPTEHDEDYQLVLIEGPSPISSEEGDEFPFREGDQLTIIAGPGFKHGTKGGEEITVTVIEVLGENSNGDEIDDEYRYVLENGFGDEYDSEEEIRIESKSSGYSTPMNKLNDTTKVSGQNKQKTRKGDKTGKVKDDEYYSSGEDNRGALRFPHSENEEEFYKLHGEVEVHDHPANTGNWITTVTNKAIGNKFENHAPLSSDNFFLTQKKPILERVNRGEFIGLQYGDGKYTQDDLVEWFKSIFNEKSNTEKLINGRGINIDSFFNGYLGAEENVRLSNLYFSKDGDGAKGTYAQVHDSEYTGMVMVKEEKEITKVKTKNYDQSHGPIPDVGRTYKGKTMYNYKSVEFAGHENKIYVSSLNKGTAIEYLEKLVWNRKGRILNLKGKAIYLFEADELGADYGREMTHNARVRATKIWQ